MKRIDVGKRGMAGLARAEAAPSRTPRLRPRPTPSETAAVAKPGTEPVSVRIHKADGKWQEERTYPRSADPRWSKG
jgi:hypothetical protein